MIKEENNFFFFWYAEVNVTSFELSMSEVKSNLIKKSDVKSKF